ncbi:MAG: hypothetical protein ABEN55_17175, partial [Bradymonadaceae bacterium]
MQQVIDECDQFAVNFDSEGTSGGDGEPGINIEFCGNSDEGQDFFSEDNDPGNNNSSQSKTYHPTLTWYPNGNKDDPNAAKCTATYKISEKNQESSNKWGPVVPGDGNMSMMGKSVGAAGIGTVLMPPAKSDTSKVSIRRSVAVFGNGRGGAHQKLGDYESLNCTRGARRQLDGQGAIYVVDLQTGSLLRRFTNVSDPSDYLGGGNGEKPIPSDITGSVALFQNGPGELTTRGFVGDAEGRLYRIDFTDPNPANWEMSVFYDPKVQEPNLEAPVGPVTEKPAVAIGRKKHTGGDLVVVYGLGSRGDQVDSDADHAVLSIRETTDARKPTNGGRGPGDLIWAVHEDSGSAWLRPRGDATEKMTGNPKIYNNYAYFTTYKNGGNVCIKGTSRIWGLTFDKPPSTPGNLPPGAYSDLNCTTTDLAECADRYVKPEEASLLQGITVAPAKSCQLDPGQP